MTTLTIALRLVHIVCGSLWIGFAVFAGLLLMPSVQEAGPAGGQVMAALQKRGVGTIPPVLAIATLVSGIWLYWNFTAGFTAGIVTSVVGAAYGIGGVAAIVGFVIGMAVLRPAMLRLGPLARQLATLTDDAARAPVAKEIARLRSRGSAAGIFVAVLLLASTALMAVARYL